MADAEVEEGAEDVDGKENLDAVQNPENEPKRHDQEAGLQGYCRNSCSRGLRSCGCIRRMGSIVTQPKMMEETVHGS